VAAGEDLTWAVNHEKIELDSTRDAARALRELIESADGGPGPLALLARHLPIAVLATNAEGRFTVAQGAALDRLGFGHGELVGRRAGWFGPEAREVAADVRQGQPHVFEAEGKAGDTVFRFRCVGVPDGDDGGLTLVIDLTSVLEAELAATEHQELIQSAIDASGACLILQSADGTVLTVNDAARAMLGPVLDGTVATLHRLDPIHEDGHRFALEELPSRTALRTGQPQRSVVMGVLTAGAERRWITATSYPLTLDGEPGVMTAFSDVSDRHATEDVLRHSDERFRLLAEEAPLGIFMVGKEGDLLYVNPAAEELAGRPMHELREHGWENFVHPDDLEELFGYLAVFPKVAEEAVEYRLVQPDGSIRWVRSRAALLRDENDEVIGLVGTSADITDLRVADERLRESEERTRAIVETAAEGIVTFSAHGQIVEFNAAAERIFGYDSEEVIGQRTVLDLLSHTDREDLLHRWADYLDGERAPRRERGPREMVGERKDGTPIAIELTMTELTTSEGRLFTALVRDLSENKAFERELEHLATHDPLTGLPNRTFLVAQLESALRRASRHGTSVGVLMVEIDRVKLVTEALGHRAGDELIQQAANRLRSTAGLLSTVARFSNDQFVVLVEDLDDVGGSVELAVQIIDAVNDPFMIGADEAFVNASVGIAFAPNGMGIAETLISNADVAMGRARSASLTRYEVFDFEMRAWVEAQRKTEIALRHGIERAEFELFYQPVVALEDGSVSGVEALVRWNHPQRGRLLPKDFIPIAEDSGLIVPMGEQILREAILQAARWSELRSDLDPMSVAINLSARQLTHPELVDVVRSALREAGTNPSAVSFEITETVLLDDVDAVVGTLDSLKDLGVQLSLDDFGTGYSSLTYLCRLPIDTVKVDRSFVSQIGTDSRDASIAEMVVAMARTLHLDVVAEGVETHRQAAVLRRCGCKYGQGFLFSEPQPAADIDALLRGAREATLHG
jgi:diguanylate cyclase (GGDEF)-like protein/PAS domain S-box-containing protein